MPLDISSDMNALELSLPDSWEELEDEQLHYALGLIAKGEDLTSTAIRCMMRWGKVNVVCRWGDSFLLEKNGSRGAVDKLKLLNASRMLSWLGEMPQMPIRMNKAGGGVALAADFQGVEFQKYLYVENLYQGYISTQQKSLLQEMAEILYDSENGSFDDAEVMGAFYWWTGLKSLFFKLWNNFFAYNGNDGNLMGEKPIGLRMKEAMNAQIRALTGGDITKEKEILKMDTWRALTELDAKAKDYKDMERNKENGN